MNGYSILEVRKHKMVFPPPDFRIDISITIADEVIRMGCLTVGFVVAVWGIVKMTDIMFGKREKVKNENSNG